MTSLQIIWKRIDAWFEHMHASEMVESLRSGATDAELQQTESSLGILLPDEVKASYRIHNGSNGKEMIGDPMQRVYHLYSSAEIVMDWQVQKSWMDEYREDEDISFELNLSVRCCPNRGWWWHPKWLPLLANQKGVRLCLDLAPGPAGQVGQIIALDSDAGDICPPVVAISWQALLAAFADNLEAGDYSLQENSVGQIFLS